MSVLVGNSIRNHLKFVKQKINSLSKREPNDSISLSPNMKYLRNLSPNSEENNLSSYLSKMYNSPNIILNNARAEKINQTQFNLKRLTINNLTNISKLNVYFLINSEKDNSVEKNEMRNTVVNSNVIKSKEPEDNVQRTKIDMIIKKYRPSDSRKQKDKIYNKMYSDKFKKKKNYYKTTFKYLTKKLHF